MDDERAIEGLNHLQAAAVEMIAAARAFLDVAEDLVRDPGTAAALAQVAASVGQVVRTAATQAAKQHSSDTTSGARGEERVERIRVL
jgi:hypothetical protein